MVSEAQKKAVAKYKQKYIRQIVLRLNKKTDSDILTKLDAVDNRQGYIKKLIREDIGKEVEYDKERSENRDDSEAEK
jgi:hypothetical protein